MSKGDLLLLAVDDVRVHGERLEGTGVDPTIAVPFGSRYSAGWDPQLEPRDRGAIPRLSAAHDGERKPTS